MMIRGLGLLILASLLGVTPAWAVNAITPGAVTVLATFESLSVQAPFTGDDNANATVLFTYRVTGSPAWLSAYTPFIDRRATVGGAGNPYVSQARGSIVGLQANTTYDIQATWTDADGVNGQPSLVTATTVSASPPTGSGTTRTITDNTSLDAALAAANAGDTLHLNPGTYHPFTVSRSGTGGAWIIIEGDAAGTSIVTGAGVGQNILVSANFIILQKLTLSTSDFSGLIIGAGQHDLFVQNNTIQAFSRLCADGPSTTHYGDAGILIGTGATNSFVLANTVTGSSNLIGCLQSPSYNGPGTAIQFFSCTTCVIADNIILGNGTRDAIASDQSNALVNVDIARNTLSGYMDDGVEFKGSGVNVRAWGNVITQDGNGTTGANSCWTNDTSSTVQYGPSYLFRNSCRVLRTVGGCSYKGPSGPLYFFHNSLNAAGAYGSAGWSFACGASAVGSGPYTMLNNASVVTNSMTEHAPGSATTFDYNCGTAAGTYAFVWNEAASYATFAAFTAATAQEAHGVNSDPLFTDATLHITAASPCANTGVVLNNFNSLDSAWPYTGTAPDIGFYEVGASRGKAPPRRRR